MQSSSYVCNNRQKKLVMKSCSNAAINLSLFKVTKTKKGLVWHPNQGTQCCTFAENEFLAAVATSKRTEKFPFFHRIKKAYSNLIFYNGKNNGFWLKPLEWINVNHQCENKYFFSATHANFQSNSTKPSPSEFDELSWVLIKCSNSNKTLKFFSILNIFVKGSHLKIS